jgi:hypothetical protein
MRYYTHVLGIMSVPPLRHGQYGYTTAEESLRTGLRAYKGELCKARSKGLGPYCLYWPVLSCSTLTRALSRIPSYEYISGISNRNGFWNSLREFWDAFRGQATFVSLSRVSGTRTRVEQHEGA